MRFTETEQNGKLEWLIRKDGCMHCEDPLPEGVPVCRGHHPVRQRDCRFPVRALHRLRLLYCRVSI